MLIHLKRAYVDASESDRYRVLVDRLWPRGVSKQEAKIDLWLKEIAPSTELRKWFGHDPAKWRTFQQRYFRELDSRPEAWQAILDAARNGPVTLVYSSRDEQHNNAVALKAYIEHQWR